MGAVEVVGTDFSKVNSGRIRGHKSNPPLGLLPFIDSSGQQWWSHWEKTEDYQRDFRALEWLTNRQGVQVVFSSIPSIAVRNTERTVKMRLINTWLKSHYRNFGFFDHGVVYSALAWWLLIVSTWVTRDKEFWLRGCVGLSALVKFYLKHCV